MSAKMNGKKWRVSVCITANFRGGRWSMEQFFFCSTLPTVSNVDITAIIYGVRHSKEFSTLETFHTKFTPTTHDTTTHPV